MIVEKNRLIELLHHEDERVRNASCRALESFYPESEGVIEHLLESITAYKKDSLTLSAKIRSFIPTNDDINNIITLFYETNDLKDEFTIDTNYHLILSLLTFPFEIIEKNRELFIFNNQLKKIYEHAKIRDEIYSRPPEKLWNELENICTHYNGERLEGAESRYADLLFNGLKKYPEKIKHKVILFLSHDGETNYHMEDYMVNLAGALKIEETIPHLFRIFNSTDYMEYVHGSCIRSLGAIGAKQVVDEIERQYNPENDLRDGLSEILGYIPYDFSENVLIKLLNEEQDIPIKTFLAGSLCDIFSIKAGDLIINIIENQHYDPNMSDLCDVLIPVYVYHNIEHDFSSLESKEADYAKRTRENDPAYKMTKPLREAFRQLETERESEYDDVYRDSSATSANAGFKRSTSKIGRNDPCPCGSGKKYKKCCMMKKSDNRMQEKV